MNKTLTTWLLGGALAASLTWNWKHSSRACEALPANPDAACCTRVDPTMLGLEPAQQERLASLCQRSCGESERLERRADGLQRELLARLASPEVDREAARRLVSEIAELRQQALQACVDGVLDLRSLLTVLQVRELLQQCEHGVESCR